MEGWKVLNVYGHFQIRIPTSAAARIEEDESTAAIRLGTFDDATEILISNYPLPEALRAQATRRDAVRGLVADFFNRAVKKAVGHEVAFECDVTEDLENRAWCAQGVANIEGERYWIAKVCAQNGDDSFWLMHWNGPISNLKSTIYEIFGSFRV